jgi:hypothetical protein
MKTIVSALVALSVLAGIAGSANALEARAFWENEKHQCYSSIGRQHLSECTLT